MKRVILIIGILSLAILANSQTMMPKGMKVGKVVSGTNIITIDSISQYSTNGIRFYKGATQLYPYMTSLFVTDFDTRVSSNTTVAELTDTVAAHNLRLLPIETLNATVVELGDTATAHNLRLLDLENAAASGGTDTTKLSARIDALVDTAALHLDTLQAHSIKINNNIDSISVHTDSIANISTQVYVNTDSIVAHNLRLIEVEGYSNINVVQSLATAGTYNMDYASGNKGEISALTGAVTLTITNLSDGGEGTIEVTNGASAYTLNINGDTGYTTEKVMGSYAAIDSSINSHTTISYWRSGSTLYYGFIYEN